MHNAQIGIIGGGVIGSAIARELSKFRLNVIVFEKGGDVASGSSRANSGVIHSGINSRPGSLKAKLCVKGNSMFTTLASELSIPEKRVGKLIIAQHEDDINILEKLKIVGEKNGVPGLVLLDADEGKKKEKKVKCTSALWVPTARITSPYLYTIYLAENAAINGVHFYLNTRVIQIQSNPKEFIIKTNQGNFQVKLLINAAGLNCKEIVSMVETPDFDIFPCRGEYLVLDKHYASLIESMIYPLPDIHFGVLGIHITPTIDGPILLGPTGEYIADSGDKQTTQTGMKKIFYEAKQIIPTLPKKHIINAFSGIRCKLSLPDREGWTDFQIGESIQTPRMINLIGIESPGLTAAPAIAEEVIDIVSRYFILKKKKVFNPRRQALKNFSEMSPQEQSLMIQKDKAWGRIICRCEHVTEAEVIQSLKNPLQAHMISSIKYRCRAGMGRCQGGFCTQHIVRIMQEQLNMDVTNISLNSPSSYLFVGHTRENRHDKS
jgi:glycerol-3-phosphate dehydrogenase